LGLDRDRVNTHGGAVALGHPIGATGARLINTLARTLERYDKKLGIACLCIGGGEADAIAIERCV
jgi:acetyl-CoA C-acetyltransferase